LVVGALLLPFNAAAFARRLAPLSSLREEVLYVVYLDAAGLLRGDELLTNRNEQRLTGAYRSLFERAFQCSARSIILAHNHPSGSVVPSHKDIQTTRQLQALGQPMEIELVDHFVVGARSILSMRSAGFIG
jgi:DNA repair protein RadC